MASNPFNMSMVFRADVSGAKTGVTDLTTAMRGFEAASVKAGSTSKINAQELERMAAATARAALSQKDLAVAEHRAAEARAKAATVPLQVFSATGPGQQPSAVIGAIVADMTKGAATATAAWRGAETAVGSLQGAVAGLNGTTGTQAHAMMEVVEAAQREKAALDDLRASFNPLFAASRQYAQELERIDLALEANIISEREAMAARAAAANRMAPSLPGGAPGASDAGAGGGSNSFYTGNIAAQGFDIGVTAAMGMNPAMIGLQQGSQLVQVMQQMGGGAGAIKGIAAGLLSILSPINLATMAFVAFGAAGIQWLMSLRKETKTFEQSMSDLTEAIDSYEKNITRSRASTADLASDFGAAADEVRGLLKEMAELDRRRAMRAATDALGAMKDDRGLWLPDLAWRDADPGASDNAQRYAARRASDVRSMRKLFELDRDEESQGLIGAVLDSMTQADAASTIDDQIAALTGLIAAWTAASEARKGFSADEDAGLQKMQEALELLQKQRGLEGNAAGAQQAKDIFLTSQQRLRIEQASLQYGENSIEVRKLQNAQELEALKLRLQGLGIDENSEDGKKAILALIGLQYQGEQKIKDEKEEQAQVRQDAVDALTRELGLLGASAAAQIRANALAEAEVEIRKELLSVDEARQRRAEALAKAEAQIALERGRAMRDAETGAIMDQFALRSGLERDPRARADIAYEQEFTQQIRDGARFFVAHAEATRAGTRALNDLTIAQDRHQQGLDQQIQQQQVELSLIGQTAEARARVLALMQAERDIQEMGARGEVADSIRRKALLQAELAQMIEVRTALRDAETGALMDQFALRSGLARDPRIRADIAYEQEYVRQLRDGKDAGIAHAEATRARTGALNDLIIAQDRHLQSQGQQIQQQQLELALIGQTAEVRARVLALMQAERDIQEMGASGEVADGIRRNALVQAELAQTIEAQAQAWQRVQSAGEAAIDGVLDKLREGDVKGAMAELLGEIEKGFFDLAIRNPLKNAIFGTNLGTWEDVGGWGGIWGRLTGQNKVDEAGLARAAATPIQSMMVTAANVTLAGNLSGIGMGLGNANTNAAPISFAAGLPGGADVQSQIWQFFAAKGLAPHQIAGVMGNISGESGFDPFAKGDFRNGAPTSFGLFQHHAGRGQGLLDAVGGMGGLGNIQAQLEFVWQELLTTERAALERLKSAPTVSSATDAWMRGFERPSDDAMAQSWGKRLAAAEQAAAQFGHSVQAAGAQVDQGGAQAAAGLAQAGQGAAVASQGLGLIGQLMAGIGGIVGGKTGSILNLALGVGSQWAAGVPLFKSGGFTGGSDPDRAAGVVHEGEFVFDAAATRRIGIQNLEGIRKGVMRGFRSGGYVGASPITAAANASAAPVNMRPQPLNISVDVSGARGDREIEAMVQQAVSVGVSQTLELYDREALPARIRQISNDPWGN